MRSLSPASLRTACIGGRARRRPSGTARARARALTGQIQRRHETSMSRLLAPARPEGTLTTSAPEMSGWTEEPGRALRTSGRRRASQEDAVPPGDPERTIRRPGAVEDTSELLIRPTAAYREARGGAPAPPDHHRCAGRRLSDRGRVRRSHGRQRYRGFRRISKPQGWRQLRLHMAGRGFQLGKTVGCTTSSDRTLTSGALIIRRIHQEPDDAYDGPESPRAARRITLEPQVRLRLPRRQGCRPSASAGRDSRHASRASCHANR